MSPVEFKWEIQKAELKEASVPDAASPRREQRSLVGLLALAYEVSTNISDWDTFLMCVNPMENGRWTGIQLDYPKNGLISVL